MSKKVLKGYLISNIFQYFHHSKSLNVVKYSKKTQKLLNVNLDNYKINNSIKRLDKKYSLSPHIFQVIYEILIDTNKEVPYSVVNYEMEQYIKYIILYKNLPQWKTNKTIVINPFGKYLTKLLSLSLPQMNFAIEMYSLNYKDNTSTTIHNNIKGKISKLIVDLSGSQKIENTEHQKNNINTLISANQYNVINIKGLKKSIFTYESLKLINFSQLEELYLSQIKMQSSELKQFINELKLCSTIEYPKLKVLELSIMNIDDSYCEDLGTVIYNSFNNITTLNLQGNKITPKGIIVLMNKITICKDLEEIDFSYNDIGTEGFIILKQFASHFTKLKTVKMYNNKISENFDFKDFENLFRKMPNLEVIDYFETRGITKIIDSILLIPNLKQLRLISPDETICDNLNKMKYLDEIILLNCINIDEILNKLDTSNLKRLNSFGLIYCQEIPLTIISLFPNMNNLTLLNLSYNSIESITIQTICAKGFCNLVNLNKLYLEHNEISESDCIIISESLIHLKHLQEFNISSNPIGLNGMTLIAEGIRKNCIEFNTLIIENCCKNEESDIEWEKFWSQCAMITKIESLSLMMNNMQDSSLYGFNNRIGNSFIFLKDINIANNEGVTEMWIKDIIYKKHLINNIVKIRVDECDFLDDDIKEMLLEELPTQLYIG